MKKIGFALVGFTLAILFGIIIQISESKTNQQAQDSPAFALEKQSIENHDITSVERNGL